ncbi:TIGR01777 family protein [Parashewanella spongiae]|uniref:TIGR01777 family protein n=1 Tax=Parashewanella spongiae TaxID=342950 RepID=A0A3A6TQA4_9GAMM|nr:TIGR01777 family oxidoreductase [Parashewanella spongiae]MCL1077772.1 TIGR01777 family oxidoreductase [Parashewanella spongiae]RJY18169.1 TIGR01777 family protein [Parashewanella spongiae]
MNILITGGTGFIGRQLVALLSTHHQITVLTRNPTRAAENLGSRPEFIFSLEQLNDLNDYDLIINLAGEPIVQKRWTTEHKNTLCKSRWDITAKLSELILNSSEPPSCFISASAIGYYGRQNATSISEGSPPTPEFTHHLCHEWERLALLAQNDNTRVCILRIGVVLGCKGGALEKMLPLFKYGLGGPISSGKQGMSWIHERDLLRLIQFLMSHQDCRGVFNATAPNPVSNRELSKTLGRVLKRPAFIPMPSFVLKMLMGEMSDLLTEGQYVSPQKAMGAGFEFNYPTLNNALTQILGT